MEEETKICSNPECIHNGTPQPLSNFHKDWTQPDGYKPRCKDCRKKQASEFYTENRDEILERTKNYNHTHKEERKAYKQEWKENNPTYDNEYYLQHKDEFKEYKKNWCNEPARYDLYFDRLSKYEECQRDPENPELMQVRCKYYDCREWFNPTNAAVQTRLKSIEGKASGENNLYCSQECKDACPLYRMRKDPAEKKNKTSKTCRSEILQDELRELVLIRDNYICQGCGRSQKEFPDLRLICHHIIPVKVDPGLASDMNNCKTLCEECHKEAHKQPGCTLVELARL